MCYHPFLLLSICLNLLPLIVARSAVAAGPAVEPPHQACATCHLPGGMALDDGKQPVPTKKRACIDCHFDSSFSSGNLASAGKNHISGHAADGGASSPRTAPLGGTSLDRLDCQSCHVPHFQGQPKLLRLNSPADSPGNPAQKFDPTSQLCLRCHPVAAEFKGFGRTYLRHPIGIPVVKTAAALDRSQLPPLFDIKGTQDPMDDVIGCTTCHFPHASKNPFLLRWSGAVEISAACLKCHPEVGPPKPGNATSLWARR